jgi:hypothetical protein
MAEITLDKSTTALLMADFSAGNMAQNPIVHERQTFERAGEVLAAARRRGFSSPTAFLISGPAIPRFPPSTTCGAPCGPREQCCRRTPPC